MIMRSHRLNRLTILIFRLALVILSCAAAYQWIHVSPGNPSVIVSAPHAESDLNTAEIVKAIAEQTGFSAVTVDNGRSMKTRFNVNRPTIGGGLSCANESSTESAKAAYQEYRAAVLGLNSQPILYIEIHGESGNVTIQVATVGITVDEALWLKRTYSEIRDKHLNAGGSNLLPYDLLIEPADAIQLTASCAKKIGIFHDFRKVIHMELPRQMRSPPYDKVYSSILADLLRGAAAYLDH
jgi:hypothetical protein